MPQDPTPRPAATAVDGIRHWLVLPDGTVFSSGEAGQAAIRSVTLEESVNDEAELMPGAAGAASITVTLWADGAAAKALCAGQELACYRQLPGQQRELLGRFIAEQPTRATANTLRLTAYDRLILADRDLSPWLRGMQGRFPMPLLEFAGAVCAQCGLTLENDTLPNGAYPVQPFYADGLTGRDLLQWVGQAAGCFCRATPQGGVRFGWYTPGPSGRGITPGGGARPCLVRLAGRTLRTAAPPGAARYRLGMEQIWYHADSLRYESYTTAPLEKIIVRQSGSDVGVQWPPGAAGTNALVLEGNLLLCSGSAGALRGVAQTLYERLHAFTYTPCTVTVDAASGLRAGMVLPVEDAAGRRFTACVMQCTLTGRAARLESSGSARRDVGSAVSGHGTRDLRGKMLEIKADIDGLTVKAGELAGGYSELRQTTETIRAEVAAGDAANKSLIEQTAASIRAEVTAGDGANKSLIEQNTSAIQLRVEKSGIVSAINQSAEAVKIQAGKVSLEGLVTVNGTFKIDEQGYLQCIGGTIGGWQITSEAIGNGKPYTGQGILDENGIGATGIGTYGGGWAFWAGDGRYSVDQSGRLHAVDADITGTVNANAGVFNSVTISGSTFGGTLDSPGGSYVGSISSGGTFTGEHSGGSLSYTGGSFTGINSGSLTGTHSGGTVSSCNLGGTSLTTASGSSAYVATYSTNNSINVYGGAGAQLQGGSNYIFVGTSGAYPITIHGAVNAQNGIHTASLALPTQTVSYGTKQLAVVESAAQSISDHGEGRLDAAGVCAIVTDPVLGEMAARSARPTVLLTPYGEGQIWVDAENSTAELVLVRGTPGLAFAWQMFYRPAGGETERLQSEAGFAVNEPDYSAEAAVDLEHTAPDMEILADGYLALYAATAPDYGAEGAKYYTQFERSLA